MTLGLWFVHSRYCLQGKCRGQVRTGLAVCAPVYQHPGIHLCVCTWTTVWGRGHSPLPALICLQVLILVFFWPPNPSFLYLGMAWISWCPIQGCAVHRTLEIHYLGGRCRKRDLGGSIASKWCRTGPLLSLIAKPCAARMATHGGATLGLSCSPWSTVKWQFDVFRFL